MCQWRQRMECRFRLLDRPVIAGVIVDRMAFVIPLPARAVGSIDDRKAGSRLRSLARYEREPNRKTAAGALPPVGVSTSKKYSV